MKPRVLHVIDHTGSGGAQVVIRYIVQALKERLSFAVAVLGRSGEFSAAYRALGIPVYELGGSRWDPSPVMGLVQTIRHDRYDLVHTHLFKSNILGTIAAKLTGCRTILHDHTGVHPQTLKLYFPNGLLRHGYLCAYRFVLGYCDRAIVLTSATRQTYLQHYRVDPQKITVLPNAIDIHQFSQTNGHRRDGSLRAELGLSADTTLVIMVGRLEPQKDWWTFLEVSRQAKQASGHRCAFLVVGSGSEGPRLRDYARIRGLEHVFFLGHRSDVPALLRQADVFLLTSRHEPLGIVLLEAMAAGCPVVATRSGGPESVVRDGVDGLLADVGDVQGLTNRVIQLWDDGALSQRLAHSARQTVVNSYSLQVISARMANIYREVLEQ